MTAVAILMLVEQGKIDLDKPAAKLSHRDARLGAGVTVRNLLQHTAGIPDTYGALEEQGGTPTGTRRPEAARGLEAARLRAGDPVPYSDSGYDILGVLIERVSGRSYPRFMEEHILRPAGMKRVVRLRQGEAGARSSGRSATSAQFLGGWELRDDSPLNLLYGSGGVYSTVADLARYDRALFGSAAAPPGEPRARCSSPPCSKTAP